MLTNSDHHETIAPIIRRVHVGVEYDAVVDWGGLERLGVYLQQLKLPSRIFIVTDSHLRDIYAAQVTQDLAQAGFEPFIYTVPAGEASKSQEQVIAIYDWLIDHHAERREALIALGGGMIGDLVGYVAATYLRGVPFVQVPTSLLAQVDAAIGGKTGINHPKGKNMIGAFYHPRLVLADPSLLFTLPERSRTEGWAEVVKYGIILDAELFVLLESHAGCLWSSYHVSWYCRSTSTSRNYTIG
jgi:3-dehydroquinate synthetase